MFRACGAPCTSTDMKKHVLHAKTKENTAKAKRQNAKHAVNTRKLLRRTKRNKTKQNVHKKYRKCHFCEIAFMSDLRVATTKKEKAKKEFPEKQQFPKLQIAKMIRYLQIGQPDWTAMIRSQTARISQPDQISRKS